MASGETFRKTQMGAGYGQAQRYQKAMGQSAIMVAHALLIDWSTPYLLAACRQVYWSAIIAIIPPAAGQAIYS